MDTPGAGDGNRTRDTLLGGQMLYRLSYTDVDAQQHQLS